MPYAIAVGQGAGFRYLVEWCACFWRISACRFCCNGPRVAELTARRFDVFVFPPKATQLTCASSSERGGWQRARIRAARGSVPFMASISRLTSEFRRQVAAYLDVVLALVALNRNVGRNIRSFIHLKDRLEAGQHLTGEGP